MAKPTFSERLWAKVDKNGPIPAHRPDLGPCWLWQGTVAPSNYGTFSYAGRVHRWTWKQEHGPVPAGLELDHLCRVKLCVRPSHLEAVTHLENVMRADGPSAVNARKTHCHRGHEFTEENTLLTRASGSTTRFQRVCRQCNREKTRERRALLPKKVKIRTTHCPQGHEYTPENTYLTKDRAGLYRYRACRACALLNAIRQRKRLRELRC